jgi:hypothetical protein
MLLIFLPLDGPNDLFTQSRKHRRKAAKEELFAPLREILSAYWLQNFLGLDADGECLLTAFNRHEVLI